MKNCFLQKKVIFAIALIVMSFIALESKAMPVDSITISPGRWTYPLSGWSNDFVAHVSESTESITLTVHLNGWDAMYALRLNGEETSQPVENVLQLDLTLQLGENDFILEFLGNGEVWETFTITVMRYDYDVWIDKVAISNIIIPGIFYNGSLHVWGQILQCILNVGDFSGDLPLSFKIDDKIVTFVLENVQANSYYFVTLEFDPVGIHNIFSPKRIVQFSTQVGDDLPYIIPISIIGQVNAITSVNVVYGGSSDIDLSFYTVTFEDRGVSIAQQTVEDGNQATKPADPEREGYDFVGWFTDNYTFLNEWDFETDVVTQDITLFAKWELSTGTVRVESPTVKVYPNPVKDELRIESNGLTIKSVEIFGLSGKTVYQSSNFSNPINVSVLSQGIYFLKIETEKGVIARKFVKE